MNIELQEIIGCRNWAIEPVAGKRLYKALMEAVDNHREGKENNGKQKTEGFFLSKKKSFAGKLYVGNIHRIENKLYWDNEELAEDDQIVNVVVIEGAVTRNGGACTYGSKDHRDQIIYANTIPQVVGHVLIVNTPGGMVSAMHDYTIAFENCRELGKPTVAFVDGICFSAGEWITSQCDRVVAMNKEDELGCIGAMCCGELTPHGAINTVTQERFFLVIGKASPDKNREVIEAANGNYELLQAEADKDTDEFHKVVRENRPMVTDDLLTGKTFKAKDVLGKLVDEIGNFNRAIECVFELAEGKLTPARDMEVSTTKTNENMTEEEKKAAEAEAAQAAEQTSAEESEDTPKNEETPSTEDEPINEDGKPKEEASAEEDELGKATAALNGANAMIEQKDKEIADLQSAMNNKAEAFSTLNATAEQQAKEIADQKATIDALTKQVAELRAEVKELSEKPAPMVGSAAGVPTDNATGDAVRTSVQQTIKAGMTYEEIRAHYKKK